MSDHGFLKWMSQGSVQMSEMDIPVDPSVDDEAEIENDLPDPNDERATDIKMVQLTLSFLTKMNTVAAIETLESLVDSWKVQK